MGHKNRFLWVVWRETVENPLSSAVSKIMDFKGPSSRESKSACPLLQISSDSPDPAVGITWDDQDTSGRPTGGMGKHAQWSETSFELDFWPRSRFQKDRPKAAFSKKVVFGPVDLIDARNSHNPYLSLA